MVDFRALLKVAAEHIEAISTKVKKRLTKVTDEILHFGEFAYKKLYFEKDEYGYPIKNPRYKLIRFITFPWHYIWILYWYINHRKKVEKLIYDDPGIHIIIGPPGCGKSSLMFYLAERLRILSGKTSYINSEIEKPRLSEDKQYKYTYHKLYAFTDFFDDRRLIKEPNHHVYASLMIDEAHRILNYRENSSSDYNDRFIPFIKYSVLVRKNIKKIYMSTQMGKVDTQLMSLAKTITQPRVKIGFDYKNWLVKDGLYRLTIKGFYIDQYGLDINGEKTQKPINSFYIRNEFADFDYFETMAMNDAYAHIQMDQPKNIIRERVTA